MMSASRAEADVPGNRIKMRTVKVSWRRAPPNEAAPTERALREFMTHFGAVVHIGTKKRAALVLFSHVADARRAVAFCGADANASVIDGRTPASASTTPQPPENWDVTLFVAESSLSQGRCDDVVQEERSCAERGRGTRRRVISEAELVGARNELAESRAQLAAAGATRRELQSMRAIAERETSARVAREHDVRRPRRPPRFAPRPEQRAAGAEPSGDDDPRFLASCAETLRGFDAILGALCDDDDTDDDAERLSDDPPEPFDQRRDEAEGIYARMRGATLQQPLLKHDEWLLLTATGAERARRALAHPSPDGGVRARGSADASALHACAKQARLSPALLSVVFGRFETLLDELVSSDGEEEDEETDERLSHHRCRRCPVLPGQETAPGAHCLTVVWPSGVE